MRLLPAVLLFLLGLVVMAAAEDARAPERREMIEDVRELYRSIGPARSKPELDPRVLDALERVPRHEFVPEGERASAYRNRPLPIGHRQTISQPFIVALMTDLLETKPDHRVLEVGTGSGYQAAVLSQLVREVYSIEIVPSLGKEAAETLQRLGYTNVTTRIGDGYRGWPEHAPYDGIIVTAAPDHVPPDLVEQLKPGGRLVIPVGGINQDLMVIEKNADGTTTTTEIVPVRFVPLTREHGK
jgi:protein-L-isoaspartate(D-aspartate) O-methyltransferase